MGLFSKKHIPTPTPEGVEFRGGCAAHDMRGPARKTFKEANKDANAHAKRMHPGGDCPNGYVEMRKSK